VLEIDLIAGEGVGDLGDSDLDGGAVLERTEVEDGAFALEVGPGDQDGAEHPVALVEAAMVIAEDRASERDGLALDAVRLDVTAKWNLHETPPVRKYWYLSELRLKIRFKGGYGQIFEKKSVRC